MSFDWLVAAVCGIMAPDWPVIVLQSRREQINYSTAYSFGSCGDIPPSPINKGTEVSPHQPIRRQLGSI